VEPDLLVEMENPPRFKNTPHTFQDGKGIWIVRFQTTSGAHCVSPANNDVTGDLVITPRSFPRIEEGAEPDFQDVEIRGTQGTWSFECCIHQGNMVGSITVVPPDGNR
jgi:hypothetical protein